MSDMHICLDKVCATLQTAANLCYEMYSPEDCVEIVYLANCLILSTDVSLSHQRKKVLSGLNGTLHLLAPPINVWLQQNSVGVSAK